jgi:hypothetical protein
MTATALKTNPAFHPLNHANGSTMYGGVWRSYASLQAEGSLWMQVLDSYSYARRYRLGFGDDGSFFEVQDDFRTIAEAKAYAWKRYGCDAKRER